MKISVKEFMQLHTELRYADDLVLQPFKENNIDDNISDAPCASPFLINNSGLSDKYLAYIKWMNDNSLSEQTYVVVSEQIFNNLTALYCYLSDNCLNVYTDAGCREYLSSHSSRRNILHPVLYYFLKIRNLPLVNKDTGEQADIDTIFEINKDNDDWETN